MVGARKEIDSVPFRVSPIIVPKWGSENGG